MQTLILYALCTSSLFYLGSRALITSWLWSRYPHRLAVFMDCPACSGTWFGALVGSTGGYLLGLPFCGLPGARITTVLAVALASMTFTPLVAALMQLAMGAVGHAVEDDHGQGPG